MNTNRRLVLGILLTGLLFLTGFLLRDFLLANIVKPMALLLWAGNRLIASIDQAAYWIGLILVLVFIGLARLTRQPVIDVVEPTKNESATLNSIRHWRTLILLSSSEPDKLDYLKPSLQTLLKALHAAREPSQALWRIHENIEQGDIRLPDSIREYLLLDPPAKTRPSLVRRLKKQSQAEYYQSIAEVVSYLEKQLENEDE